jgi:hypothetical protein
MSWPIILKQKRFNIIQECHRSKHLARFLNKVIGLKSSWWHSHNKKGWNVFIHKSCLKLTYYWILIINKINAIHNIFICYFSEFNFNIIFVCMPGYLKWCPLMILQPKLFNVWAIGSRSWLETLKRNNGQLWRSWSGIHPKPNRCTIDEAVELALAGVRRTSRHWSPAASPLLALVTTSLTDIRSSKKSHLSSRGNEIRRYCQKWIWRISSKYISWIQRLNL